MLSEDRKVRSALAWLTEYQFIRVNCDKNMGEYDVQREEASESIPRRWSICCTVVESEDFLVMALQDGNASCLAVSSS
jgi:hypothetical protein